MLDRKRRDLLELAPSGKHMDDKKPQNYILHSSLPPEMLLTTVNESPYVVCSSGRLLHLPKKTRRWCECHQECVYIS
jgi:hypothetical protein